MKVGDRVEILRTFSAGDLLDYAKLCGHNLNDDRVPEPLIGALFSFLLGTKLPGRGTMYLKQETRIFGSARVDEPLIAEVEITRLRPEKQLADLSTTCRRADGELIASGCALVHVGDVGKQSDLHG